MFKILFICTDNIGRSLTAEYLLKNWLLKNNRRGIEVASAGIEADSDISSYCLAHMDRLGEMGIDVSGHKRTQLTQELLEDCDLAIAMEIEQQKWIMDNLGLDSLLYNEICKGEKSSFYISAPGSEGTMPEKLLKMVEYFEDSLPIMMRKIDKLRNKL